MKRMKSKAELGMYCNRIAAELGEKYKRCPASVHGVFYTGVDWEASNNVAMAGEHVRACMGLDGKITVGMDSNMKYFVDVYTSCDHSVEYDGVGFVWDFLMISDAMWSGESYIDVRRGAEIDV